MSTAGPGAETFDSRALRAAIAGRFPELGAEPLVPLAEGWDSEAFTLGGRLVVKRPRKALAEAGLRREAAVLSVLRPRVSLPVPDLQLVEDPLLSWHQMIPGTRLEAQGYEALTLPQRAALAGQLARFMAEVHAVNMPLAGAVQGWADPPALSRAADLLPGAWQAAAQRLVAAYAALEPDPLGEVFGQFDGHGWNMAFDHAAGRLNGIYDFGDSGIGPRHRDFIYCGLTSLDLMGQVVAAYREGTGLKVDLGRVGLLSGAHRLWELGQGAEADQAGLVQRFGFWLDWAQSSLGEAGSS